LTNLEHDQEQANKQEQNQCQVEAIKPCVHFLQLMQEQALSLQAQSSSD
jgi:hypothetical protein